MLTKEEEKFFNYWKEQRLHKKKFLRKLSIGLPLAALAALAFVINLFSGWYTKAMMQLNSDPSVIIVILVALVAIVIFITIFSAYHRSSSLGRSRLTHTRNFFGMLLAGPG